MIGLYQKFASFLLQFISPLFAYHTQGIDKIVEVFDEDYIRKNLPGSKFENEIHKVLKDIENYRSISVVVKPADTAGIAIGTSSESSNLPLGNGEKEKDDKDKESFSDDLAVVSNGEKKETEVSEFDMSIFDVDESLKEYEESLVSSEKYY